MTRNTKIIIVLCVLALWIYLIFGRQEVKADPAKSTDEIRLEKWTEIWKIKIRDEKREAEKRADDEIKEKLLQEFNGTGFIQ
jgi:hypothetical protein